MASLAERRARYLEAHPEAAAEEGVAESSSIQPSPAEIWPPITPYKSREDYILRLAVDLASGGSGLSASSEEMQEARAVLAKAGVCVVGEFL